MIARIWTQARSSIDKRATDRTDENVYHVISFQTTKEMEIDVSAEQFCASPYPTHYRSLCNEEVGNERIILHRAKLDGECVVPKHLLATAPALTASIF